MNNFVSRIVKVAGLAALSTASLASALTAQEKVPHVIHISVDANGAKYLAKFIEESPDDFKNYRRIIKEGASTLNARTDYTHTNTLPNHTCMVTGRPVKTPADWQECKGHQWEWNGAFPDPGTAASIHAKNPEGTYTSSVFDVAHENGLKTALYSGKFKFKVYSVSYGEEFGKAHPSGKNKIDRVIIGNGIHQKAMTDLKEHKPAYTFLHYPEPDTAGHAHGYLGDEYRDAVKQVDGWLGELLDFLETDAEFKGRSAVIISADHGGEPGTKGHGAASHPYNYTIPFLVWGAGVARGADLYKINQDSRQDPGEGRPEYAPTGQPIRNGDGGNLALKLLGLPPIPGSFINNKQDLKVR